MFVFAFVRRSVEAFTFPEGVFLPLPVSGYRTLCRSFFCSCSLSLCFTSSYRTQLALCRENHSVATGCYLSLLGGLRLSRYQMQGCPVPASSGSLKAPTGKTVLSGKAVVTYRGFTLTGVCRMCASRTRCLTQAIDSLTPEPSLGSS